mgnify:CR=1 FL=1
MANLIRNNTFFNPRSLSRDEWLTPFDRLLDDLFTSAFPTVSKEFGEGFFAKGSYPKVNILDNNNNIVIEAAVPGLNKEDVKVEVQNNVLTIRGENNQNSNVESSQYVKREIKRSAFQRSFNLGENLDEEGIVGECENGVLTLTIPKIFPSEEEDVVRTVDIK